METIRTVGEFELVFEPLMKMFRIVNKETEKLSMWFDAETSNELEEMDDDEFSTTAQQYIQDASYAN
ncbi:hypothetical protein V5739_00375 [Salinimicrobium sp. TIG7-5_MAKvit]|uniref:hypothetical protein n=1 Tax=Salinimicrobium sp. TIG7-5_MAKvit TaxID=3121289 RepID=UPI003C6E879F